MTPYVLVSAMMVLNWLSVELVSQVNCWSVLWKVDRLEANHQLWKGTWLEHRPHSGHDCLFPP